MLTPEERARLRAEEEFRAAVRDELDKSKAPPGFGSRVWRLLNSQFGGWLLGTVVVAGSSLGLTAYLNWRNHEVLHQQELRVRAREDGQTVSTLLPHLGSQQAQVAEAAAVVLAHLSKNGIDKELAAALDEALERYQKQAASSDATPAQRGGAEASASVQDSGGGSSRITAEQAAAAVAECQSPPAVLERRTADATWAKSPQRVYLHIADESQRDLAERLAATLRQHGYLAPGVENVGDRSPRSSEIRFFNEEDVSLAAQVFELARRDVGDLVKPKCPPLYARRGHLEVFFSKTAGQPATGGQQ
jgi:hypothetical protein